jgi:hypothetical protein
MQKPSVGRVVHYVSYGTPGGEYSRECRAAIITEVAKEHTSSHGVLAPRVGLCVMNPTGLFLNQGVALDLGAPDNAGGTNLCDGLDYAGGTWHWPART